jgi:hypothetical protein
MGRHCETCLQVSGRLRELLETRRLGQITQQEEPGYTLASFGPISEIRSRKDCDSCIELVQELLRWKEEDNWHEDPHLLVDIRVEFHKSAVYDTYRQTLYVITRAAATEPHLDADFEWDNLANFYLLEKGFTLDVLGRVFDPNESDINMIKGWLECCEKTHGDYCTQSLLSRLPSTSLPADLLLVDIEQKCLAYGTLDTKYAALSYVWGKVDTLCTMRATLNAMLQPGGLDFQSELSQIPLTIRDFLRLAAALGFRYAWVDSLCIVQDDDSINELLNGMAAIFASAHLTVASEGIDANAGLPGTGGKARPRARRCPLLRLPGITCTFAHNHIPKTLLKLWDKRAWTFQEGLFSRRVLFVNEWGMVSWKCPRQYWNETTVEPSEAMDWAERYPNSKQPDWRYLGFSEFNFTWPDMRRWCELVEEYFNRELSYDADAMSAISGLITVVQSVSPGGFLFGMPELFFDIFLLWDVDKAGTTRRRDCSNIPSWSFLGWKGGDIDLFWWRFSMDYTFLDNADKGWGCDCEVGSIVSWHVKSLDSTIPRPVKNDFHSYRYQSMDNLEFGWTKHESEQSGICFKNESVSNFSFRYPIPLSNLTDAASQQETSQYLQFKSKRGWLYIGDVIQPFSDKEKEAFLKKEDMEDGNINFSLLDDEGCWVGAIRLPLLEATSLCDEGSRERVELVEIATGKVANDAFPKSSNYYPGTWIIPEWDCEKRPKQDKFYRFYFVLCIEWLDGIAYRRGLGRVETDSWDKISLEEVDIILG